MTQQLLPHFPGCSIEQVTIAGNLITVVAQAQTTSAVCPDCACASSRVHSRYTRQLADLPWSGRAVRLIVRVRRFFCTRWTCARKTFAEALPALTERYARRTIHLTEALVQLGLALGGEAGAPLAAWLKQYPSLTIITRDRSGGCAEAARQGAPQAIQVADKWHLIKNLGEALEVLLARHLAAHRKQKTMIAEPEEPTRLEKRPGLTAHQERVVQIHRTQRLACYEQVISLARQGLSQEAIAQLMGMGHSTVERWLAAGAFVFSQATRTVEPTYPLSALRVEALVGGMPQHHAHL